MIIPSQCDVMLPSYSQSSHESLNKLFDGFPSLTLIPLGLGAVLEWALLPYNVVLCCPTCVIMHRTRIQIFPYLVSCTFFTCQDSIHTTNALPWNEFRFNCTRTTSAYQVIILNSITASGFNYFTCGVANHNAVNGTLICISVWIAGTFFELCFQYAIMQA